MAYRDDRDALMARLEAALAENRRLQAENNQLREELAAALRPPPPPPPRAGDLPCPQCTRTNSPHYKFCLTCGYDLAPTPQPAVRESPRPSRGDIQCRCGHYNAPHYKFCLGCGAEVVLAPAPQAGLQCRKCGQLNASSLRFCSECGDRLKA